MDNNDSKIIKLEEIRKLMQVVRELIESKNIGEYIEFGYEPRLLESILLLTYSELYYSDSKFTLALRNKLPTIKNQTFNKDILYDDDMRLQGLLLELYYLGQSSQESINHQIINWYEKYREVLEKIFPPHDNDFKKYYRKLLSFSLIALFSIPNKKSRKILENILLKMVNKTNISRNHISNLDSWRKVYYYLFYCLRNPDSTDIAEILEELFLLQVENGSWNNNNLLTLLVVHTIKYTKFDEIYSVIVKEGLEQAEEYLFSHQDGITVLDSQGIYNSVLYYFMRSYFEGKLPSEKFTDFISKIQNKDGGWSLLPKMSLSDVDTTVFAMALLFSQSHKYYESIKKGMKFIERISNDGVYSLYSNSDEQLPEMIARVIILYSLLPPNFISHSDRQKHIRLALRDLIKCQREDGTFISYAYSFSILYGISQAALAIYFLRHSPYYEPDPEIDKSLSEMERKIVKFLEIAKNENGSYSAKPGVFSQGEQQSTCYACMSHALLRPGTSTHTKALNWLLNFIESRGVQSYPEGSGPRPIRYNGLSHGPIFIYISFVTSLNHAEPKFQKILVSHKLKI
ncbi:MAG: prenyltransferase/squalene oxidase repeat-containing protein [Candidatus Hodarchaeales archaeon]